MNKLIDLSLPFTSDTPVYPGDPVVEIKPVCTHEKDGLSMHSYQFGGHTGTHIDAATHFIKGGKNLSNYPLEKFTGEGTVVDARGYKSIDIDILKNIKVEKDIIILFWTDYWKKMKEKDYFEHYPILSERLAKELVKQRVKIVGMDAPSFDQEPTYPVHKILLGQNILLLEGLCNLDKVYGKKINISAIPIKVRTDGVPVRVVAFSS